MDSQLPARLNSRCPTLLGGKSCCQYCDMSTGAEMGKLIFAATPMGNAGDASQRLLDAIAHSDLIAAEDTRKFRNLASRLGVEFSGRVISNFEGNELGRVDQILDSVRNGEQVLVVTDAGMPNVSDPGYRLASAAIEASLPISVLPGPSAILTALVLSGLPSDRFCFEGFLPRKSGERNSALTALAAQPRTMIFFEAPHRLEQSLADMAHVLGGDRRAAICREMTKTYEEVIRGSLSELAQWAQGEVRGEITLVVEGASDEEIRSSSGLGDMDSVVAKVQELTRGGMSLKDASAHVAALAGMSKREVYQASLEQREQAKNSGSPRK